MVAYTRVGYLGIGNLSDGVIKVVIRGKKRSNSMHPFVWVFYIVTLFDSIRIIASRLQMMEGSDETKEVSYLLCTAVPSRKFRCQSGVTPLSHDIHIYQNHLATHATVVMNMHVAKKLL